MCVWGVIFVSFSKKVICTENDKGGFTAIQLFEAKIGNGWTAFPWACKNGHKKLVDLLIKNSVKLKIDLNAKDIHGYTIFQWACKTATPS